MSDLIRIAVVGHTNTGKTSLLRTLTRDTRFGEVSGRPGTTRHVEVARLQADGRVLLELYDTPGIEDAIDLLSLFDQQSAVSQSAQGSREDGPTRVRRFLESVDARQRFEQEAKVLRQLSHSDAALYVIDARDPVLAKHRDELEILSMCGVPLLPLLNFVSAGQTNEQQWREVLAGLGLHAIVRFDTVAPPKDGERILYTKLATLLDAHRKTIETLIRSHERDARQRHETAMQLIAVLLLECAAMKLRVSREPQAIERGVQTLNDKVRKREQACVAQLLSLYRFYPDDIETDTLPLVDGRWQEDIFDPYTLQNMGIKLGGGAAAGAAAGLGIDLMVGGMTLGAAALTGAMLGGGLQTLRHYGGDLLGKLTGERALRIDDGIIAALATRQLDLVAALERRGHAAQQKLARAQLDSLQSSGEASVFTVGDLPPPLRMARSHVDWGQDDALMFDDAAKQQAAASLAELLERLLEQRYNTPAQEH
ncbi:GTPase/DUF3482 domain-containing protein [Pseudohongiella spirulinae]|uniref:GTPase SAR1 n=1 Tax=Pseudohongiella spirulinae TaxID=1249552 RepID=A0A0S2KAN1_9GAMM|nr:GTPase/DUF3482 domain-containing protein [Pseudohongiella spirulinae]ALO45039.1 GTPase SAR1 [Pseudohongiella spirulinae]